MVWHLAQFTSCRFSCHVSNRTQIWLHGCLRLDGADRCWDVVIHDFKKMWAWGLKFFPSFPPISCALAWTTLIFKLILNYTHIKFRDCILRTWDTVIKCVHRFRDVLYQPHCHCWQIYILKKNLKSWSTYSLFDGIHQELRLSSTWILLVFLKI